jgi:hypothetical protein
MYTLLPSTKIFNQLNCSIFQIWTYQIDFIVKKHPTAVGELFSDKIYVKMNVKIKCQIYIKLILNRYTGVTNKALNM